MRTCAKDALHVGGHREVQCLRAYNKVMSGGMSRRALCSCLVEDKQGAEGDAGLHRCATPWYLLRARWVMGYLAHDISHNLACQ